MKLSVACNFDDALLDGLRGYPVYEIYGKLTSDFFGGGRPSFYLPEVDRAALAAGANGLMVEVHPCPAVARSDSQQQLDFEAFIRFVTEVGLARPARCVA